MYTVEQLVTVAKHHGADLAPQLPALNGFAHARGRSEIIARSWVEQVMPKSQVAVGLPGARRKSKQLPPHDALLEYPPHAATCWIVAHDMRAVVPLWFALGEHALARDKPKRQQTRVRMQPCVFNGGDHPIFVAAEVARVVVAEHGPCAPLFAAEPRLRCWLIGVDAQTWNRRFMRAHDMLTESLLRWHDLGLRQLRSWIAGDAVQARGADLPR